MEDKKRERRTSEQLAEDHFNAKLKSMTLEEKVALVKSLKEEINTEVAARKAAAESANSLTSGL